MAEGSLITNEMKKLIGTFTEFAILKVSEDGIQRFAQAIGDPNPLFNDVEYARKSKYGRLICPPCFHGWPVEGSGWPLTYAAFVEALNKAGAPPRILDGGNEYEFFEPVGAGDILASTAKIVDITEKEGKSGRMVITTIEVTLINQNGDVVTKARSHWINR